ncbi:MAG: hypothetical protein ACREJ3_12990 [Polyangiaceae bacterium]
MRRSIAIAILGLALSACSKSDHSGAATSATASTPPETASAPATAPTQPVVNASGDVVDPSLPAASESEDTSDITAASYKADLAALNQEIDGMK